MKKGLEPQGHVATDTPLGCPLVDSAVATPKRIENNHRFFIILKLLRARLQETVLAFNVYEVLASAIQFYF